MKKAHVLAEHPIDEDIRYEVFVDDDLAIEFKGDYWLPCKGEDGEMIRAMHRGTPIRVGSWILGKPADPSLTLAEFIRNGVLNMSDDFMDQIEITEF